MNKDERKKKKPWIKWDLEKLTVFGDFGELLIDFGDLFTDFGDLYADFGDLCADFRDLFGDEPFCIHCI